MGTFKIFVNELFKKNFSITFMENIKKIIKKKSIVFSISHKKFLKVFPT